MKNILTTNEIYAYIAGALDSDGYFTIKRSTYAMRVRGDAYVPVFSEKIGLKQTSPLTVDLLYSLFGGSRHIDKPSARNGKPLYAWSVSDKKAIHLVHAILPYLRIKKPQAEILLKLRESKEKPRSGRKVILRLNRWGQLAPCNVRVIGEDVLRERSLLFEAVKGLNDTRPQHPLLI